MGNKIQNEDVKSQADLVAQGLTSGEAFDALIDDTKIAIKANSINKTLNQAIIDGDLSGGGGGGSGGINYLEGDNSNAEASIGDWITYHDSSSEIPIDGVGGTANVTFTRSASLPLRGDASFLFAKDSGNRQGQGASVPFTIDSADLEKKLTISFDYDATDANYADGDVKVFIYDITNSVLIRVNGEDLQAGKNTHYAQFQTDSVSTSYRLILHVSTTKATAYNFKIDNVKVGPTNLAFGAFQRTETIDLTGLGDFTGGSLLVSRSGNLVNISVTSSITFASSSNPDALNVIPSWARPSFITRNLFHIATGLTYEITIATDGELDFVIRNNSGTLTATTSIGNGSISYPVDDGLSSVRTSEDLGGREIAVSIAQGLSQTVADGLIDFKVGFTSAASVEFDTTAIWNTTNLGFTIKESGYYDVFGTISFGTNADDDANGGVRFKVNGAVASGGASLIGLTTGNTNTLAHSTLLHLDKGDFVELFGYWTDTASNTSVTITLGTFKLAKRSSPQTMLETETVAARYTTNSGQSVPVGDTTVIYEDIDVDTHNSYNISTGIYTVPTSGFYQINARTLFNVNAVSGDSIYISILLNGTIFSLNATEFNGTNVASTNSFAISDQKLLIKGDEISIRLNNSSGETVTLSALSRNNTFSIARIK